MKRCRTSLSFFLAIILAVALVAQSVSAADPEPAQPAQPPNEEAVDASQIKTWFNELADTDAEVRDAAQVRLMGIGRGNLEAFRDIVKNGRPLAPAQAAVLRQIVYHVYLSGAAYEKSPGFGFLGVRMQPVTVKAIEPPEDPPPGAQGPPADPKPGSPQETGIIILSRIPGFCAARLMRDGDVLLAVNDMRVGPLMEFATSVRNIGAGHIATFELLRMGRVIKVSVKLDARPAIADVGGFEGEAAMAQFNETRREACEGYWAKWFKPLLQESVG